MKKKSKAKDKTKARGGLAADMAQEAKVGKKSRGARSHSGNGATFGFSMTSVVRKLKQEGMTPKQIVGALGARGLKVNIGTANSISPTWKSETAAKLTKEQVEEIRSAVPKEEETVA